MMAPPTLTEHVGNLVGHTPDIRVASPITVPRQNTYAEVPISGMGDAGKPSSTRQNSTRAVILEVIQHITSHSPNTSNYLRFYPHGRL